MNIVFWILLVANILLSILFPMIVIPFFSEETVSEFDSLLCSMLAVIALFLIEIFVYISIMYQQKKREERLWEIDSENDRKLFNIKQKMKNINLEYYSANDLFEFYLNRKLDDLSQMTEDAESKKEIRINDNMIELTREMYYSAFIGDSTSIFRPMYLCDDNEFFLKDSEKITLN